MTETTPTQAQATWVGRSIGVVRRQPGSILLAWLIALMVVGYPLAGLTAVVSGLDSILTSVPFRTVVVVLAALAVITYTGSGRRFRLNGLILLFFWLYSIRLLVDVGRGAFEDAARDTIFFLGTVVAPAAAIMVAGRHFDEYRTASSIFIVGVSVSAFSLLLNALGLTDLTETTGRLQFESVNAIALGHVAVSTLISAVVIWPKLRKPFSRGALLTGCVLCLALLILAASRGPVLALVLAMVSLLVLRGRWGLFAAGGLLVMFLIPSLVMAQGLTIFSRFTDLYQDLSILERLDVQSNAIAQFLASPLFGSAYREINSGQYPHNLFIETLMALGLFGFTLYVLIVLRAGALAWSLLRIGQTLLPLLFVQFFVNAQLSDSLLGGAFWALLVLIPMQSMRDGRAALRSSDPLAGNRITGR